MSSNYASMIASAVSRRRFMTGALAAGAVLSLGDRLALAQNMTNGSISAKDIHGIGVNPGLVRMSLNENPIGASPRALEAIARDMFKINR